MVSKLGLRILLISFAVVFLSGARADAASELLPVLLGLTIIILVAKMGGTLAQRFNQPAVLGELGGGIFLGNIDLLGTTFFEAFATNPHLLVIAELGVLLLLFEVGLESTVKQMLQTGLSSLLVALLGVVVPVGLGYLASALLLPELTWHTHLFVGATLAATSVGITARVLKDLGRSRSLESRTILGAAVIDDVLGLVVLAVVGGAIKASQGAEELTMLGTSVIVAKAGIFLFGALLIGVFAVPRLFWLASRMRTAGMLLAVSLAFCFALSWAAGEMGLAAIIGAFAAGLVLEEVHFRDFADDGHKQLEELIHPLVSFLAPVFFVIMGMRTDLSVFVDPTVMVLALVLVVVAIAGKQAAALGVVRPEIDKMTVGLGMVPRGEVGLIFANYGHGLTLAGGAALVLPESLFSALIVVVLATTMFTPPTLRWSIARAERRREQARKDRGG